MQLPSRSETCNLSRTNEHRADGLTRGDKRPPQRRRHAIAAGPQHHPAVARPIVRPIICGRERRGHIGPKQFIPTGRRREVRPSIALMSSDIERAARNPTITIVEKLGKPFGFSASELLEYARLSIHWLRTVESRGPTALRSIQPFKGLSADSKTVHLFRFETRAPPDRPFPRQHL